MRAFTCLGNRERGGVAGRRTEKRSLRVRIQQDGGWYSGSPLAACRGARRSLRSAGLPRLTARCERREKQFPPPSSSAERRVQSPARLGRECQHRVPTTIHNHLRVPLHRVQTPITTPQTPSPSPALCLRRRGWSRPRRRCSGTHKSGHAIGDPLKFLQILNSAHSLDSPFFRKMRYFLHATIFQYLAWGSQTFEFKTSLM